jgi:hypothetical protein
MVVRFGEPGHAHEDREGEIEEMMTAARKIWKEDDGSKIMCYIYGIAV